MMNSITFGVCAFLAVFSGSMAQSYNSMMINQDLTTPYVTKISSRISTALISPEQRDNEGSEILRQAEHNFRQCKITFGGNPTLIGSYKGCLGRFTGMSMSQISALEGINRNGANNDMSLLIRNANIGRQNQNLNLQNRNLNSQFLNKHQSSESNENSKQSNTRSRGIKYHQRNESNENLRFRSTKNNNKNSSESNERQSNLRFVSNKKSINNQHDSRETRRNRNNSNDSY